MKKSNTFILFILPLLAVSSFLGSTACTNAPAVSGGENVSAQTAAADSQKLQTVRIGGVTDPLTDSGAIAQNLGYLDEELAKAGYKPEIAAFPQAGPAINEALTAKAIDFAIYTEFPQLMLFSSGVDIRAIATILSDQQYGVIVREDSGIKDVRGLAGKNVIVPKGTGMEKVFYHLTAEYNIAPGSINQLNALADQQSLYASGQADAAVSTYLGIMLLKSLTGGEIIFSTAEKPEWSTTGLLAGRADYMEKNPEAAKALIRALQKAYRFAAANHDRACEVMATEQLPASFIRAVYAYSPDFSIYNPVISDSVIARIEDTNNFLAQQGLIPQKVDLNQFIDKSYYEAVQN